MMESLVDNFVFWEFPSGQDFSHCQDPGSIAGGGTKEPVSCMVQAKNKKKTSYFYSE